MKSEEKRTCQAFPKGTDSSRSWPEVDGGLFSTWSIFQDVVFVGLASLQATGFSQHQLLREELSSALLPSPGGPGKMGPRRPCVGVMCVYTVQQARPEGHCGLALVKTAGTHPLWLFLPPPAFILCSWYPLLEFNSGQSLKFHIPGLSLKM